MDGLEPKRIRFVHPYKEKESNIFLLEAVKGGKPRMIVEPPLIVYEQQNKYTKENNWKLIRIPYWEFDNIEKILTKELIKL